MLQCTYKSLVVHNLQWITITSSMLHYTIVWFTSGPGSPSVPFIPAGPSSPIGPTSPFAP